MKTHCSCVGLLAILACLAIPPRLVAQSTTGTIQGTVSDEQEAVVPGAMVTIRNVATNAVRRAVSERNGFYRVLNLPVGEYTLTIEATGVPGAVREGMRMTRDGGRLIVVGQYTDAGDATIYTALSATVVPNAAIFSASYLLGPSFAVGVDTVEFLDEVFGKVTNPGQMVDSTEARQTRKLAIRYGALGIRAETEEGQKALEKEIATATITYQFGEEIDAIVQPDLADQEEEVRHRQTGHRLRRVARLQQRLDTPDPPRPRHLGAKAGEWDHRVIALVGHTEPALMRLGPHLVLG